MTTLPSANVVATSHESWAARRTADDIGYVLAQAAELWPTNRTFADAADGLHADD